MYYARVSSKALLCCSVCPTASMVNQNNMCLNVTASVVLIFEDGQEAVIPDFVIALNAALEQDRLQGFLIEVNPGSQVIVYKADLPPSLPTTSPAPSLTTTPSQIATSMPSVSSPPSLFGQSPAPSKYSITEAPSTTQAPTPDDNIFRPPPSSTPSVATGSLAPSTLAPTASLQPSFNVTDADTSSPTLPPDSTPSNGTDDDYYYDDDIIIAPGVVTSKMAPYDYDCDYDDQEGFPNVFDQCKCDGEITIVPEDVAEMRDLIITRMFNKIYQNRTALPLESCDPSNMALIWLASGDNRDAGEVRQRFALGMVFFQLNGTIWDYTDEWLSDLNECLWLGVQCNNRDAVNSLALDTNNIFGPVCTVLYSTRNKEHRAVLHCVQRGIIHSQFSLFLFF
jgi:hypothetical protein